jgi:hypothetical protein
MCTAEPAPHRQSELAREIVSLVEAAAQPPPGMERHGDDSFRPAEHVGARFAQPRAERDCECATPLVFERVQKVAQRALVAAGTARQCERR